MTGDWTNLKVAVSGAEFTFASDWSQYITVESSLSYFCCKGALLMSVFRVSTNKALTRSSADDGVLTLFQKGANQVSFSRKWRATIPHYTLGCMLRASSAAGKEGLAGLEHIGTYRNMLSVLLGAPTFRGQNYQMIGMPFAWDTTIRKGGHPSRRAHRVETRL
jgi:hypothetical protein